MPKLKAVMRNFLQDWRSDVAPAWRELLDNVEPDFEAMDPALTARADEVVFPGRLGQEPLGAPEGSHIFRALDRIYPRDVRVIVVGQDPYPRISRATGRAFEQGDLQSWTSTSPGVALSLKRIVQQAATKRDGNDAYMSTSGGWARVVQDLRSGTLNIETPQRLFNHWQSQGVLFLNTGLTLTRYKPGGHPHQLRGHIPLWATVVGAICYRLARRDDTPVVFLIWGSKARTFLHKAGITRSAARPVVVKDELPNTDVVDRDHPAVGSFLSGMNVFDETNSKLSQIGADVIYW